MSGPFQAVSSRPGRSVARPAAPVGGPGWRRRGIHPLVGRCAARWVTALRARRQCVLDQYTPDRPFGARSTNTIGRPFLPATGPGRTGRRSQSATYQALFFAVAAPPCRALAFGRLDPASAVEHAGDHDRHAPADQVETLVTSRPLPRNESGSAMEPGTAEAPRPRRAGHGSWGQPVGTYLQFASPTDPFAVAR